MPPSSKRRNRLLLATLCVVALLAGAVFIPGFSSIKNRFAASPAAHARPFDDFPRVILWAWERPEDFNFIDTRETGVAYLARTLHLRDDRVVVRPRLQPLRVPAGTTLVAVARIESDRSHAPKLSTGQRAQVVSSIAALAGQSNVRVIQVDFDATLSQRAFYRDLLFDLRRRLPAHVPLSITALASWCMHDDWLAGLPVDEAVPMLFRMGADERGIRHYLDAGEDFRAPLCRSSYGLSTDETPPLRTHRARRLYLFHTRPWSSSSLRKMILRLTDEHQDS